MGRRDKMVIHDAPGLPARSIGRSWAGAALVGIVLFFVLIFSLAGASFAAVLLELLTDGLLVIAWFLAAAGLGWMLLRSFRTPLRDTTPLLRFVTYSGTGLGFMSLALLGLSLAGALNWYSAIAILAAGLLCCAFVLRTMIGTTIDWYAPAGWGWAWLLTVPMLAIAVLSALVPPGVLWREDPMGYDVVEYHLQVPREWFEAGRMMPLAHNVFSYFPFNVEMHYLAAMQLRGGPWAGMYAAQLMHVAFVMLSVLAVAGVAGAMMKSEHDPHGSRAAALAGVAAASAPWMTMLAAVAYDEGGLLLFGTLAVGWAALALRTDRFRWQYMLIAGAMTGFACGSKLTAIPVLLTGIPAAILIVLLTCPRDRKLSGWLVPGSAFVLAATLALAPWLIRTAVWAGNPVFPELLPIGHGPFSAMQVERWEVAHSPTPQERPIAQRLRKAWREIAVDWRYGLALLPLAVGAVVIAVLSPLPDLGQFRHQQSTAILLASLLFILLVFWIGFTHLQSRFFVFAIPLAALLVAQVRWRCWPAIALGVLAGQILAVALPYLMTLEQGSTAAIANIGALGIDDLSGLRDPSLGPLSKIGRLRLVGDAKAFLYQMPMSDLTYRTVFDVNAKAGESDIDAWLAGDAVRNGDVLLIDDNELRRFAATYRGIPAPPPDAHGVEILRK